jgi:hypothetical protein
MQEKERCVPSPRAQVTTDKLSLDDGPNMFYVLIDEVRARAGCGRTREARGAAFARSPRKRSSLGTAVPPPPLSFPPQSGRVYIAITSKAYPSRYIYGSPDGATRGVLAGASQPAMACRALMSQTAPPALSLNFRPFHSVPYVSLSLLSTPAAQS